MYTTDQQSLMRRIHGMLHFQQMRQERQLSDAVRALIAEAGVSADAVAEGLKQPVTIILNWADQKDLPGADALPDIQSSIMNLIETELARADTPVLH